MGWRPLWPYRGYRRHVEEDTFGKLLYGAGRPTGESMISFTTRFQAELTKYEVHEAAPLPGKTRVRLLLRKSNLSQQQKIMFHTWAGETPDSHDDVIAAMHRLDDPRWNTTSNNVPAGKTFHTVDPYLSWEEEEVDWPPDYDTEKPPPSSLSWPDPAPTEVYEETW